MSVDRISLLVQCKTYSSTCKLRMCMHASITIALLLFCARRDIVVAECTTVDVYLERSSM